MTVAFVAIFARCVYRHVCLHPCVRSSADNVYRIVEMADGWAYVPIPPLPSILTNNYLNNPIMQDELDFIILEGA
jgi:hypothetical protein